MKKNMRRILALILALAMTASVCCVSVFAAAKDHTKEPMILVGGLSNYSPDSKLGNIVGHYMGGFAAGDYAAKMRGRGLVAYESTQSPFASIWDRACELYANIKGGRVDYGAAHSAKYGHERYGRVMPGLYPEWDNDHPVDLFGYSMGAPTTRILASLHYYGDKDEQAAAPNDCSALFKGGHGTMVNSVSTISGTNNGTTFADMVFNLIDKMTKDRATTDEIICKLTAIIGIATQGTDISELIAPMFDQWGFQPRAGETNYEYIKRCLDSNITSQPRDICWYDMTTWGSKDIMEAHPDNPDAYYFAYACKASKPDGNGPKQVQGDNLFILGPLIYILGHYKEDNSAWGEWQDKWYENDGMVNTAFAKAPFESKSVEYYDGIVPERGTWVNMPELINVEHNGVVGFYLTINKKVDMLDFFTLQTRYVQALK